MYSYSPSLASKVPCWRYLSSEDRLDDIYRLHFMVNRGPISCSLHFSPSSLKLYLMEANHKLARSEQPIMPEEDEVALVVKGDGPGSKKA